MSIVKGTVNIAWWWLRGLPPVKVEEAQGRAEVCKRCLLNRSEDEFEALKGAAARAVKAALEQKHKLKLDVEGEEQLGVCDACGCELKLLVWAPGEVVKRSENQKELWSECWKLKV